MRGVLVPSVCREAAWDGKAYVFQNAWIQFWTLVLHLRSCRWPMRSSGVSVYCTRRCSNERYRTSPGYRTHPTQMCVCAESALNPNTQNIAGTPRSKWINSLHLELWGSPLPEPGTFTLNCLSGTVTHRAHFHLKPKPPQSSQHQILLLTSLPISSASPYRHLWHVQSPWFEIISISFASLSEQSKPY